MRRWIPTGLLLLPLIFISGCATNALWTESALDEWNQPASNPDLHLFDAKKQKDFLVVYDEYSARHNSTKTRAYFLKRNEKRISEKHAPHFVKTNLATGLPAVPVFSSSDCLATGQILYAVIATNSATLTLYSDKDKLHSYSLPVYNDGVGRYERVALTPVAVTIDATVIGGICAIGLWASAAGAPDDGIWLAHFTPGK